MLLHLIFTIQNFSQIQSYCLLNPGIVPSGTYTYIEEEKFKVYRMKRDQQQVNTSIPTTEQYLGYWLLLKTTLEMEMPSLILWSVINLLFSTSNVNGHGRLMDPPQRSTLWRFYKDIGAAVNYNDNELFCGGFGVRIFVYHPDVRV